MDAVALSSRAWTAVGIFVLFAPWVVVLFGVLWRYGPEVRADAEQVSKCGAQDLTSEGEQPAA